LDQIFRGNLNCVNGIACIYWSGFLLAAVYRQKIPYSKHGQVVRSESPKLFWLLLAIIGAVVVSTGAAFVLHRG